MTPASVARIKAKIAAANARADAAEAQARALGIDVTATRKDAEQRFDIVENEREDADDPVTEALRRMNSRFDAPGSNEREDAGADPVEAARNRFLSRTIASTNTTHADGSQPRERADVTDPNDPDPIASAMAAMNARTIG